MTEHERTASASHVITLDDACAWLAAHGFPDIHLVQRASIEIEQSTTVRGHSAICAWLDVVWVRTTPDGKVYADGDELATATATVPLRSLPNLTDAAELDPAEAEHRRHGVPIAHRV